MDYYSVHKRGSTPYNYNTQVEKITVPEWTPENVVPGASEEAAQICIHEVSGRKE
jgi:hypothetical protein